MCFNQPHVSKDTPEAHPSIRWAHPWARYCGPSGLCLREAHKLMHELGVRLLDSCPGARARRLPSRVILGWMYQSYPITMMSAGPP